MAEVEVVLTLTAETTYSRANASDFPSCNAARTRAGGALFASHGKHFGQHHQHYYILTVKTLIYIDLCYPAA
jgi:hypothetical protein